MTFEFSVEAERMDAEVPGPVGGARGADLAATAGPGNELPTRITPATVLRMQRLAGNRAVSHLMSPRRPAPRSASPAPATEPAVQRYFLHTPGAHQATAGHFEAQQKGLGGNVNSFLDATNAAPVIQPPLAPLPGVGPGVAPAIPQLRVSDDGQLAIEGTDLSNRQAKVFFTTPAVVRNSNARLTEVGSPYKLTIDQANALTIAAGPINSVLSRVVPEEVAQPANMGTGFDLGADRCNEVAEKATQSGSLAGQAGVQATGLPTKMADPEYRLARYVTDRMSGLNHIQAMANVNNVVDQTNMQAISDAYTGLMHPDIATGEEVKNELILLGVNPRQNLETALGNYLVARGAGQNHATAAGGTLGGLNLNAAGLASIDRGYKNLKVPAMAQAILVAAQAAAWPPAPPPPANLLQLLERYVTRRLLEGQSHAAAAMGLIGINAGTHDAVRGAIDAEYANQLGAAVGGATAASLADEVENLTPNMKVEYQLIPYVRARVAGQNHLAAAATVPNLSAAVLAQLDAAYNNAQGHHALTPGQRAAALTAQLQSLGVNQFAAPEVGQIFGSGFTGLPGDDRRTLNYRTGERLNASDEAWSSHYGSVVATSGGDRITLENYARVAENAGDQPGRTKQYYFQMYGSQVGQSWHEVWSTAGRPVMNAVTFAYGKDKATVWAEQLNAFPPAAPGVTLPHFQTMVGQHQALIKAAVGVPAAKIAYYSALDQLAATAMGRHRLRGEAIGPGHGVTLNPAHLTVVAVPADGQQVATELGQWIVNFTTAKAGKWRINVIGRHKLDKRAASLGVLQAKINEILRFYDARRV